MKNLHELPKFADKLSYLYVEYAVIDQCDMAIAIHQADGTTPVPAAGLGLLILGPGTKITHAAVKALAENNCQVIWAGQRGVRFYAHGLGGSHHSRNLIRQARLVSNDLTRLQVVIRMYALRFEEPLDPGLTLQQIRGKEGIRVRQAYAEASRKTGVPWHGRSYKRNDWKQADPVNRALSAANACLYGLTHAAIASGPTDVERQVRIACRDIFRRTRMVQQILPDIEKVLDVAEDAEDEYADDPARPSELWNPKVLAEDVPIGKVLKFDPDSLPGRRKEAEHDRDDSGAGDTVSAG